MSGKATKRQMAIASQVLKGRPVSKHAIKRANKIAKLIRRAESGWTVYDDDPEAMEGYSTLATLIGWAFVMLIGGCALIALVWACVYLAR